MENGVIGKTGHHVRRHVELGHRNVSARVPNHAQHLAGKIALVLIGRANHVKKYPAQVKSWFQYFFSPFSVFASFSMPKLFFRFSFQWTVDGLTGKTGHRVRGRVGLDRRNVCARAPNHDQLLAGKIALVSVGKPSRAKRELVQVT